MEKSIKERLEEIELYKDEKNGYNYVNLYGIANEILNSVSTEEMLDIVIKKFELDELIQVLLSIAVTKEL